MKRILPLLFLVLLFSCNLTKANTVFCADSSKLTFYYHNYDFSWGSGIEYSVKKESFDLDSGFITTCDRSSTVPFDNTPFQCQDGYWIKYDTTFNTSGAVIQILKQTGSANGWSNNSRFSVIYDSLQTLKLSETNENWNGSSWDTINIHGWMYDSSGILLSDSSIDINSGVPTYNKRNDKIYVSGLINERIYYSGSLTNWLPGTRYVFYRDSAGQRSSATYETWDTILSAWVFIDSSVYYNASGLRLIDFKKLTNDSIGMQVFVDSLSITLDTLENIIQSYELKPEGPASMGDNYDVIIKRNKYFSGQLKNIYDHYSLWWDDHSGFGLNWYCTYNDLTSDYNSAGDIISTIQRARCVMPREYTTLYFYDNDRHLTTITGQLDANTEYEYYRYDFYYNDSETPKVVLSPFSKSTYVCEGDSGQVEVVAFGGCGDYNYIWSPSTGLSSDTVSNPYVYFNDSISYVVTVVDSAGQTGSITVDIGPVLTVVISQDTSHCSGCPVMLTAIANNPCNYTWYRDGIAIPFSNSFTWLAGQTGNYSVRVTTSPFTCGASSNIIPVTVTTMVDVDEILNNGNALLFPNPTGTGSLLIIPSDEGQALVNVYDLKGKKINTKIIGHDDGNSADYYLQADDMLPGIYLVTVASEKNTYRLRWVLIK